MRDKVADMSGHRSGQVSHSQAECRARRHTRLQQRGATQLLPSSGNSCSLVLQSLCHIGAAPVCHACVQLSQGIVLRHTRYKSPQGRGNAHGTPIHLQQLQCAGTLKCAQCAVHMLSGQHDARSSEPKAAVK